MATEPVIKVTIKSDDNKRTIKVMRDRSAEYRGCGYRNYYIETLVGVRCFTIYGWGDFEFSDMAVALKAMEVVAAATS